MHKGDKSKKFYQKLALYQNYTKYSFHYSHISLYIIYSHFLIQYLIY